MNEVGEFGVKSHQLESNLPGFHQFLNISACTSNSNNVVIHLNGTGETVMQQSSGISLPTNAAQSSSSSRKRKRSSAGDATFKCTFCPKKFAIQNLVGFWSYIDYGMQILSRWYN